MESIATKPKIVDKDTEIILQIKEGKIELFEELLSNYETKIYNFGLRMCKDRSDAEDLVQETFINIFKYLKNFRMESKFKNWAYKIATTQCMKIKKRNKTPDYNISLEDVLPDTEKEMAGKIPKWANQPVAALMNKEISVQIKKELDKLPPSYRLVLVLRDMEGFSTREVSEMIEISETNVKVRLHRARSLLREGLRSYFHEE